MLASPPYMAAPPPRLWSGIGIAGSGVSEEAIDAEFVGDGLEHGVGTRVGCARGGGGWGDVVGAGESAAGGEEEGGEHGDRE